MARWAPMLVVILSSTQRAVSQLDLRVVNQFRNTADYASSIFMCNKTFDAANVTGTYPVIPGLALGSTKQGNGTAFGPELQVGAAGSIPSTGIQLTVHVGPGKGDFLDNTKLGYDICMFLGDPGAMRVNTWFRAQSDNGSSLQTYDTRCKAAMQEQFNNLARSNNKPYAQGVDALSGVCQSIFDVISKSVPIECKPFFNDNFPAWLLYSFALTQSPNTKSSSLARACQSKSYDGSTFYNIFAGLSDSTAEQLYNSLTRLPAAVVTLFLPITNGADSSRSVISEPYTEITMGRMNIVNPGSQPRPSWPDPAPVDYSSYYNSMNNGTTNNTTNSTTNSSTNSTEPASVEQSSTQRGLTGGAIGGIVGGAAALLIAISVFAFFCIRRRRRLRSQTSVPNNATELDAAGYGMSEKHIEMPSDGVHEMSPTSGKTAELASSGTLTHELPTGVAYGYEMDGSRPLVELPGDYSRKDPGKT